MALFDETPLGRIVREQSLGQPDPALRQYTPDLGQAALSRGAEQAVGLGADYLGSVAGSAGQRELADDLYQFADDRIRSAGRRVAGPQTTDDITGPGQLGDFIVNKAGESLPVSAAAIAGGLATRGRGLPTQLGASSLPIFPTLAGETSYAMRNDPESGATELERAVASTGAGAASAALEVLPEVGILNRVLGRSAVEPAKDMARAIARGAGTTGSATAGEAVTEAAQTAVSRTAQSLYNENIGVNPITDAEARKDYIESAAAGAAGGTAFGVPAGVATTLQNLPTGPDVQLPQGEDIRQFIGDVLTPRSERIAPEDIPANMDDAVAQEMQRDQTLTERARAFRDRLMQRGDLTPEEAASIDQEVELDPDAQDAVFDLYERKAVQDTIRNSIARMQSGEGRASRVVPNIPMEAVDSIIQEAGIDEASATPEVRQWLAVYQEQLSNGAIDRQTIADALNIFGERGYSVLRVLAGSNQDAQNAIDADQANNGQLDNFLFQALKPEYRDSILPGQLRQLGNMVRDATQRGDGNLDEILGVAFQNPREVMAGLDTLQRNTMQGVAQQSTESEDGGEIGDTQSVQDVEQRYFGNTRGNRRIKTGGLNIPHPMSRDEFGNIVEVARNARGLAPESDIIEVPAVATLRRLGVDPADVAAEIGVTEQDLRNMVFLQGTVERPVDTAKGFISTLRTNTIERLNNTPRDRSAGSYLGMKTGNNRKAALDVRLMVNSRVFGNRQPAALLQAFADGVSLALSEGYKLDGPIPDNLVLARYGRGSDEVTVTLGEAKAAVGSRAPTSAEGNMPLDPQVYNALQENGYDPKVDFDSGELFLPRSDVVEIIERYAAAVASRNAAARNTAIPAWTEKLIARHGVEFPEAFGRISESGSLINQLIDWARSEGVDSRALAALTGRRTDPARAVEARREREATEQAGPATGEIEADPDTAPASVVEAEAGYTDPSSGEITPREGAATRKPERPYAVRGRSDREDFFTTVRKAERAHSQQFWATGELPTGIDLQGPYAVLGKLAARGEPLQVVVSKAQGQEITPDIQRLIEAYQRRGFNIRTENKVAAPIEDAPYSERVIARVLGVDGVSPAHVVMTIGDGPSARLARRIGIPIIDLTNPVQQKIAGDVLRSYDRGRRQDISRSNDAPEVKAMKRKGEERAGADRSRDILATDIERQLAANWNNPDAIQRLDRLFALMNRVDNDFFEAGLAGRSASELASPIRLQALETYERAYNKEQGFARQEAEQENSDKKPSEQLAVLAKAIFEQTLDAMVGSIVEVEIRPGDGSTTAAVKAAEGKPLTLEIYVDGIQKSKDIATTAAHEAAHVAVTLIQAKYGEAVAEKIVSLADIPEVHQQIIDAYGIKQGKYYLSNPEELFVQAYAMWANRKLSLPPASPLRKIFQNIKKFFGGKESDAQKLADLFTAMERGDLKSLKVKNTSALSEALLKRFGMSHDFFTYGGGRPSWKNMKSLAAAFNTPGDTEGIEAVADMFDMLYDTHPQIYDMARLLARIPQMPMERRIKEIQQLVEEALQDSTYSSSSLGTERTATEEQFDNARDYIARVLPPDVRVLVKKMTMMSGQYIESELADGDIDKLIELSAYANDPMSVAHHESMHALIASMRGQEEQSAFIKALLKAADSPLVISQLRTLLRNEPSALEQMVADPEERIAYMYEFWAAGKLNLAPSVENWFVKLVRTIRGVLGILDNNEKAGLYMAAFRDGAMREPSAVNSVVMESLSGPERALRAVPVAQASNRIVRKVIETAHGRLKSYGNPALTRIADAFYSDSTVGGQRSGYLQTTRDVVNMYGSQFNEIMRGSTADSVNELATALHTNTRPADPEQAARYDQVKALLRRLYNYMRDSGVELGKVKDYYPQSWDKAAIEDDRAGFEAMLVRSAQYRDDEGRLLPFTPSSAAIATDTLLGNNGRLELQEDLAGFSPFMEASMTREIVLTDRADAAAYLDPDMIKVMTRYITQAAKRGEYTRHFGEDGYRLKQWLEEAKDYGITEQELRRDIAPAIQAMEGTLGHNINQAARDFMSGTITVLNLAVLPLAVFSSLIDPMGIAVRGGTVEQAWDAFKAGVRNIPGSVRANGKKLDIQEFAESVGTVESQFTVDMLGDMYGSAYMSDWARKSNNLLFRYNLMEGWNTAMRSSATVVALDFIKRHAAGENRNSVRYLDELGLSADTLVLDEAGNVLWRQADIAQRLLETGRDPEQAQDISRRTREGITRWVDGAVLRPHAAHRPAWASDPHYMLIWHLKQFTYSFHKTIIERVMHETKNGNYNPMLVLASYVPFMIAADYLRALVQGGGEEPPWRKGMGFGETVWEGVQRAGLLGIRQFAVDGADNPAFALGPAANYAIDIGVKAADGQVTDALVKALPGNALWKGW